MLTVTLMLIFELTSGCQGLAQPVGHYPLNASTGASDLSPSQNPSGQINHATPSLGVYDEVDGSYSFNGSRANPSFIRLPKSQALDTRYSISLLAWIYPQGGSGEIISYWENSIYGVGILLENAYPVFHVYSRDLLQKESLRGPNKLALYQWHHISGLYDDNYGTARLFVNGLIVDNTTIGIIQLKTEYDLWLGFLFKGRMARIWIFNVSLSAADLNHVKDLSKPSGYSQIFSSATVTTLAPSPSVTVVTSTIGTSPTDTSTTLSSNHSMTQSGNNTPIYVTPTSVYVTPTVNQSSVTVSLATSKTSELNVSATLSQYASLTSNVTTQSIRPSSVSSSLVTSSVSPNPLQCYSCAGSPQQCSEENVVGNSSAHITCSSSDAVCEWQYVRLNASEEHVSYNCSSQVELCEVGKQRCFKIMQEFEEACCDVQCCASDFCNKPSNEVANNCTRKPDLVAIIFGGTEVVRGLNKNITMNASLSYDPDVGPGDFSGMNFTWFIGHIKGNYTGIQSQSRVSFTAVNETDVEYSGNDSGRVIQFNTSPPMSVNKMYVIKLIVSKDYRSSSAIQIIHLVKGDPPRITQRCQINCGRKISPSVKLSIESQCDQYCANISSYEWILYEANQSTTESDVVWRKMQDLQHLITTPLNSSGIAVKQDSLTGGKRYRLAVVVRTVDGVPGIAAYDMSTALPPSGGSCSIAPLNGTSLKTDFNLSCSEWVSDSNPLSYQFQYQLDNGLYSMIYHGLNNSVISWLPPGNISDNYAVKFVVIVTDNFGASAPEVNMTVQVKPSPLLSPNNITSFVTANESLFNNVIQSGDMSKAAQIANTVLQALLRDSTLDRREKTKIQDAVIEKIVTLPVNNIPDLLQSSSVIGSATQDTDTVSVTSLLFSLSAIDTMTSLLFTSAQTHDLAVIPLITRSAENLASCLNNMLKAAAVIASGNFGTGLQTQGKYLVKQCMQLVSIVADAVLALSLPDEEMISIQARDMEMTLGRHTPAKLAGLRIEGGDGRFALPTERDTLESLTTDTSFVDTQMLSMPFNPFTWDATRERVDSDVLTLDLKDDGRKLIEVSSLSTDILITIPLKTIKQSSEKPQFFTKTDSFRFHEIDVEYENTLIRLDIKPNDANVNLLLYLRYGQRPTTEVHDLNGTVTRNSRCVWKSARDNKGGNTECTYDGLAPIQTLAHNPGKYFLAVQSFNSTLKPPKRKRRSCFGHGRQKRSCVEVKDPPPTPARGENVTVVPEYDATTDKNYTLRVTQGSCVYWSNISNMWTTDGCEVLSATPNGFLNCSCNHLTSFGGGLFIEPNPIDFDKVFVEFQRLGETGNVAVIITVAVVMLTYFVVLVIARRADKEDSRKTSPPIELSTQSTNSYEYEITIATGVWRHSGSTAKVAMEIYGTEGNTGIVQLNTEDHDGGNQLLFCRGNTDVFVLKTNTSLGILQGLRIGHDNTGDSPSWFLEDVVILDRPSNRSWTFSNGQWLGLERGDGRIERMLQSSPNQTDFNNEVVKRWWKGLTEKHTWVSVVAKPPRNRFTRVQRASCCVSVMLTAMLANAMFYQIGGQSQQVIQVGPLKFSWRQVVVGIESALIVAPINILIAFLFKKGAEKSSNQTNACSKTKCLVFVAWALWFCACVVSATFSIFYSLVWGKSISEQWLSSMLISFVQDVGVTEPVKVFFMALFLAAIFKRKKTKHDDYTYIEENQNSASKGKLWTLGLSEVEGMRKRQARKENISRFFVELFVYMVFIFLLMVVLYGNRNDHRYMMTKSIRDGLPAFNKVLNNTKFWDWLHKAFLPGAYAGVWYNGQIENQTTYIGNKHSLLVGMPRVRQIRIRPMSCDVLDYMKPLFPVCYGEYSDTNEDRTPFNKPGWKLVDNDTNTDELFRLCPKPWRYQKAEETDTVPKWGQFSFYPGGGFVADLGYENGSGFHVIETLQNKGWMDRQTRAVIVDFSTFNPTFNLLAIATYFYEIRPSGYGAPFERTEVISLYSKEAGSHQFYLICILLFIIFVIIYFVNECYKVYRQRSRYFKSIWNWVEIVQVLVSVLAVVMYIVRSDKTTSTIRRLQENVYANVSFQEAITWSEAENAVLGILTFTVTLKLLHLIRFNAQVAVLSRTLRVSGNLLLSFSVVLSIGFMAFLHFGILIFGNGAERYSSILKATYFQLELILGRVKARPINDLADANETFGRIFAGLLLSSLTIVAMNFFIAVVNESLGDARNTVMQSELDQLVDEHGCQNGKKDNVFYDVISEAMKEMKTNGKSVSSSFEGGNRLGHNSKQRTPIDFELISKAIVASRGKKRRRTSIFDKVSNLILRMKHKNKGYRKLKRKTRSSWKKVTVRFAEDVVKSQYKKLLKREKNLFESLDNIIEGFSDEEETFYLICERIGLSSEESIPNAADCTGDERTSFA